MFLEEGTVPSSYIRKIDSFEGCNAKITLSVINKTSIYLEFHKKYCITDSKVGQITYLFILFLVVQKKRFFWQMHGILAN